MTSVIMLPQPVKSLNQIEVLSLFRTLTAVYEVIGEKSQDSFRAEELFRKLDENSDGKQIHIVCLKTYFISSICV